MLWIEPRSPAVSTNQEVSHQRFTFPAPKTDLDSHFSENIYKYPTDIWKIILNYQEKLATNLRVSSHLNKNGYYKKNQRNKAKKKKVNSCKGVEKGKVLHTTDGNVNTVNEENNKDVLQKIKHRIIKWYWICTTEYTFKANKTSV